jgi:hypothetical protein
MISYLVYLVLVFVEESYLNLDASLKDILHPLLLLFKVITEKVALLFQLSINPCSRYSAFANHQH